MLNIWGSKTVSAFVKWAVLLNKGAEAQISQKLVSELLSVPSQSTLLWNSWMHRSSLTIGKVTSKGTVVSWRIIFCKDTNYYICFPCIIISYNCSPCSGFVSFLSVPEFVVAQLTCPCKEEHIGLTCRIQHCSIKAWGEVYAFEFLEDHALVSSSFVINQMVNSSFSILKQFSGNCFARGKPSLPPGAECRVTYCEGQLVSMHWTCQLFLRVFTAFAGLQLDAPHMCEPSI